MGGSRPGLRPGRAAVLLGLCLAPGCAGPGWAGEVRIEHVVLCWLTEPGDPELRARVIETSRELASIPGVLSLTVGTALPSERPIVDDSFDVGLVIGFASEAALEAYLVHPEHVSRVEQVLGPASRRIVVHDIRR